MTFSSFFEIVGVLASATAAIAGGWWGVEKWRKRDEHFPRIYFEVTAKFVGCQENQVITEVLATLENKGVVPLKIRNFTFRLLGILGSDDLEKGDDAIRRQILFPHVLDEGRFVSETWGYSFVYPGVKTEYNFVTSIPQDTAFVRVQADFDYLDESRSHHAAKVLRGPNQ